MTRKSKIKLAKVLVAFSFVLMAIGIGLNLNNKTLITPVVDTHVIGNNNSDDISITTTDIEITPETDTENNKPLEENYPETSYSPNIPNESKDTPSTNEKNPSPPNTTPSESTIPEIDLTNNNLRNSIQNKYGIIVKYGAETNGYTISGLSTVMLKDGNKINELLNTLNYNLSLYPSGFFYETKDENYSLTIYLLKRYSQANVTGITDSTTKNVVISLATDYSFVDSLHHEMYHYIEKYMYAKGAHYTTWNSLNPSGFSYGTTNNLLSYTNTQDPYAFFVNVYAQTDEYEDRASTFEYLMASTEASCLTTGTPIWKKSKYMCEQIDAVFQTVSPSTMEYWERYVYN